MAEITASMVSELRAKTDAPMMECKKALTEADGDMDKAEELLRIKLGNKASKAAGRVAAEGVDRLVRRARRASSARWSKSTARPTSSPRTTTSSRSRRRSRSSSPRRIPPTSRRSAALPARRRARRSRRAAPALVQKIGENMSIRRFARYEAKGKLATLPARRREDRRAGRVSAATSARQGPRDAHRRAASRWRSSTRRGAGRARSRRSARSPRRKAAESGKPAEDRRQDGRRLASQKFLTEVTLLGQPFVKNDKQTVEQMLKAKATRRSTAFTLYVVGEGIEKKTTTSPPRWRRRSRRPRAAERVAAAGAPTRRPARLAPGPNDEQRRSRLAWPRTSASCSSCPAKR